MQHTSALLVGLRLTSLSQCVSRFCHNCHTHLCFRGWRTTLAVLFKTATHPFGHALEIALKSPLENAGDKRLEFLELEGHLDSTLVQRFIQVSGSIRSDQSWN